MIRQPALDGTFPWGTCIHLEVKNVTTRMSFPSVWVFEFLYSKDWAGTKEQGWWLWEPGWGMGASFYRSVVLSNTGNWPWIPGTQMNSGFIKIGVDFSSMQQEIAGLGLEGWLRSMGSSGDLDSWWLVTTFQAAGWRKGQRTPSLWGTSWQLDTSVQIPLARTDSCSLTYMQEGTEKHSCHLKDHVPG